MLFVWMTSGFIRVPENTCAGVRHTDRNLKIHAQAAAEDVAVVIILELKIIVQIG